MEDLKETIAEGEKTRSKGGCKKPLLWGCLGCGGAAFLLVAAVVGIAVYALSSIFDEKPFPPVDRPPDSAAMASAMAKIQKSMLGDGSDDGSALALAAMLDGKQPAGGAKEEELKLTATEVNALLDSGLAYMHGCEKTGESKDFRVADAVFENGVLSVKASFRPGVDLGFGEWINFEAKLVPEIKDRHLNLTVLKLKIGSMDLPPDSMKETVEENIAEFETSDNGRQLLDTISELTVEKNGVTVKYDPVKLMAIMLKALSELGVDGALAP